MTAEEFDKKVDEATTAWIDAVNAATKAWSDKIEILHNAIEGKVPAHLVAASLFHTQERMATETQKVPL